MLTMLIGDVDVPLASVGTAIVTMKAEAWVVALFARETYINEEGEEDNAMLAEGVLEGPEHADEIIANLLECGFCIEEAGFSPPYIQMYGEADTVD